MIALWIIGGILAFVLLAAAVVLCLHVGAEVLYDVGGLQAYARVGPARIDLLRMLEKSKRKPAKPKKEPEKPPKQKKGGAPGGLKASLPDICALLRAFIPRLRFDRLDILYTAAGGEDPCAAALRFGGASALFGTVLAALENICTVRERNLRTRADFSAQQDEVTLHIQLTVLVFDVVRCLVPFLMHMKKGASGTQESPENATTVEKKGGQGNG